MHFRQINVALRCLIFAAYLLNSVLGIENAFTIPIEYSIGSEPFSPLGKVVISGSKVTLWNAVFHGSSLSNSDIRALEDAARNDQLYRIRVPIKMNTDTIDEDQYVMSSTRACYLVKSQLSGSILLSIDSGKERIISVAIFPPSGIGKDCGNSAESLLQSDFNTAIVINDVVEGAVPETATYIQKMEKDRREKETGVPQDNRSFLAKYWMYIVPVVIFVMVSSVMNPEGGAAQQGGR